MRDRLIDLIESSRYWGSGTSEEIADHLLANGVIVQSEGEWLLEECQVGLFGTDQYFVCSACKNEFFAEGLDYDDFAVTTKFCPNCGAKMKGGE